MNLDDIWMFSCFTGHGFGQRFIQATDEVDAMAKATKWCRERGLRPPASVAPFLCQFLDIPTEAEEEPPVKVSRKKVETVAVG